MWEGYKNYNHYFTVERATEWLAEIVSTNPKWTDGRSPVWNIPCSLDIETSSYYQMGKKYATMYLWGLNVNGSTIIGRTWSELLAMLDVLVEAFHTNRTALIIYVHNLGYEFQFMRKWLDIDEVFAVKDRRPIHVTLKNGIEFKCSYILSNYALAYIGANLLSRYPVQKDVGALDYSLVRHYKTPLTDAEIWYQVHDTQVVTSFIQEKIENEGGIKNIPLTNTGYVRQYCRSCCFSNQVSDKKLKAKLAARYHEMLRGLSIRSKCEYDQLHAAFGGGFTHAAPYHSGKLLSEVGSDDAASHYPGEMVRKKFPMSAGTFAGDVDEEDLEYFERHDFAYLMTVRFKNIRPKFIWENYISVSHCQELSKDAVVNNGRVASATDLQTTVTDVDWDIIRRDYEWDEVKFFGCRFYKYGYLPRPFILSILNLYAKKTSLKGVDGKETEYMVSKNMINSCYGMTVTAIIRDIFEYSCDEWHHEELSDDDATEELKKYNGNYNRFLFYAWGVWVTAHARHDLWDAIFEFGPDYVYADTDSIKGINFKDHEDFFILYNNKVQAELRRMCSYYKINYDLCSPKTIKGVTKIIGVFEYEGEYQLFKTIGAKRYMYEKDDEFWLTISGVNKNIACPWLLNEYAIDSDFDADFFETAKIAYMKNPSDAKKTKEAMKYIRDLRRTGILRYESIFDHFNESLYFPSNATGKQTLTYVDDGFCGMCIDYFGNKTTVTELSYIHMEPQGYSLSLATEYVRFLEGFQDASM